MTNFTIDVQGYNRIENKLRRMAAQLPGISQRVIYKWAQGTRGVLKSTPYPPKRPNQRYKRTGTLANSWRAVRLPDGATITNTAKQRGRGYARYVIGDTKGDGQAWMHAGRWWKARSIIDEAIPEMRAELAKEILKEWRK